MFRRSSMMLILLAGMLVMAGPALAQDMGTDVPPADEEPAAMSAEPRVIEEVPAEEPSPETEEAISQVPTFEEADEALMEEPPFDTFLRTAEDFIYRRQVGPVSIGRVPVWPRGNFKLGPVNIFPYLDGRGGWTDNVYQDASETSSWYLSGGGGLSLSLPFGQGQGSVFGGADYKATTYTDEDVKYSEWTANIGVGYRFQRGFWFRTGLRWSQIVNPVNLEDTGLQEKTEVYPFIDLGWDSAIIRGLNVSLGFDYRTYEYTDEAYSTGDRDEYRGWIKLSYPIYREKTRVFVRYTYTHTNADSDRINDLNRGGELSFGMEGVIPLGSTQKLTGTLQFGYRNNDYATGSYVDDGVEQETDDNDSKGIFTVKAILRYLASARTSLQLMYYRDLDYSTYSNYQVVDRFDLVVSHTLLRDLLLRGGTYLRYSNPDAVRESITEFGVGVGARYILIDNVDLDLSADWLDRQSGQEAYTYSRFIFGLGVTLYFR